MSANSKEKSSYIPFKRNAATESFVRSAHNDFATTSELKQREFTGWRENRILAEFELWISGEIVRRVSFQKVASDPEALEKELVDYFGLT